MPSADTLSIPPFRQLVKKYLHGSKVSVDPFARNCTWATYTNDLNPDTAAEYHLDALEFLAMLKDKGVRPDVVIFDPPYSPRQIAECYSQVGRQATMQDTQANSWANWKAATADLCDAGAIVISFGWNSLGMGLKHRFQMMEILLCAHGGVHNDTICTVERKLPNPQESLF